MADRKMDKMLFLSGYVNKRNVGIIMTYLYILTLLVVIASHIRLSQDKILRNDSSKSYLRKTLALNGHLYGKDQPIYDEHSQTTMEGITNRSNIDVKTISDIRRNERIHLNEEKIINEEPHKNVIVIPKETNKKDINEHSVKEKEKEDVNLAIMGEPQKNGVAIPKEIKKKDIKEHSAKINEIEDANPAGKKINSNLGNEKTDNKIVPSKVKTIKSTNIQLVKSKYPDVEVVKNPELTNIPIAQELMWQNISEDGTFMIFSAFVDRINGQPYIKALAINGNNFLPKFYCEMTYEHADTVTTKGKLWMLPDHHEMIFKTVFLFCALPDDQIPVYLSIIPNDPRLSKPVRLHRLPVLYQPKELRNFTVCLSPIFFNNSIEYELVQWFEINRLLGVDLFMVYTYSTHPGTDEILSHYEKEGWVKVIPWKLPRHTDLHYYGQNAAINDCLIRNYRISRYMVNIDIDELIVPRKGMTSLNELMTSLPNTHCEYSVRSTFMGAESKAVYEGKQKARELNLNFLLRITRREYIFDKNVRSKYIVNTTCIDTVGIHYCWKYRNGTAETQRYHVMPRDALVFHFRSEPVMKSGKEIEEKAVYKYFKQLIPNAKLRWDKIKAERKIAKQKSVK